MINNYYKGEGNFSLSSEALEKTLRPEEFKTARVPLKNMDAKVVKIWDQVAIDLHRSQKIVCNGKTLYDANMKQEDLKKIESSSDSSEVKEFSQDEILSGTILDQMIENTKDEAFSFALSHLFSQSFSIQFFKELQTQKKVSGLEHTLANKRRINVIEYDKSTVKFSQEVLFCHTDVSGDEPVKTYFKAKMMLEGPRQSLIERSAKGFKTLAFFTEERSSEAAALKNSYSWTWEGGFAGKKTYLN